MIKYIVGDATNPIGAGRKVIAHVNNDIGGWKRGFAGAVSKRWSLPESEYRKWFAERHSRDFGLGEVQLVRVEPDIWVLNMVAQRDIKWGQDGTPPIRYKALGECLLKATAIASGLRAEVHMPRIGCGLAGGSWSRVEPLIQNTLIAGKVAVVVYDLPENSFNA